MEKQRWSAEQWDERLRQRLQEGEQQLSESPFDPAAWNAMEAKLNAAQQEKKRRLLPLWWGSARAATGSQALRWAAAIAGLLMLAGLWWGLHEQVDNTSLAQQQEVPASRPPAKGGADRTSEVEVDAAAKVAPEQALGVQKETTAGAAASPAPTEQQEKGNASAENKVRQRPEAIAQAAARQKKAELQPERVAPALPAEQEHATPPAAVPGRSIEQLMSIAGMGLKEFALVYQLEEPQPVAAANEAAPEEEVVPKDKKRYSGTRLSLAITAMPDMSQVGSFSTSRWGGGGGVLLGYQLGQRLRLQAGALYIKKNYQSYQSFSPYGAGSGHGYKPLSLDASCEVLDLPLNLQYQFARGKRLRWYASAGASSYLMLSERYVFNYKGYSNTYEYQNENRHWFSILNAGVGVDAPLSKRLRMQAEPYVKLPLQGVGAGQIKLSSFGLQFQLHYDF